MNTLKAKIEIKREDDPIADLSYLGSWGRTAKTDLAINHHENGGGRDEFEYFNPENVENAAQAQENYERMRAYGNSWETIGIYATAEVYISGVRQTLRSGGLWGIESDSGEEYLKSVEAEQIAELKTILSELHIETED